MQTFRNRLIEKEDLPDWLSETQFNLCNAVMEKELGLAELLLASGGNPNGYGYDHYMRRSSVDSGNTSPTGSGIVRDRPLLFQAITYNQDQQMVELLLKYGADLKLENRNGPILVEITSDPQNECDLDMIQFLLDKGADINATGGIGPPIFCLANTGPGPNTEWIEWFLDHGADPNIPSPADRMTLNGKSVRTVLEVLEVEKECGNKDCDQLIERIKGLMHRKRRAAPNPPRQLTHSWRSAKVPDNA